VAQVEAEVADFHIHMLPLCVEQQNEWCHERLWKASQEMTCLQS
jgi:hypothetical protein